MARPYHDPEKLRGLLEILVQAEIRKSESAITRNMSFEQITDEFENTPEFRAILDEAQTLFWQTNEENELSELRNSFAGALFQNIAYYLVASEQTSNSVLLPYHSTLEIYGMLHPDKKIEKHPFGMDSMEGVSVPDGLIVELAGGPRILSICEYTLLTDIDHIRRKHHAFSNDQSSFGLLLGGANVVFAVPCGSNLAKAIRNPNVRFFEVPFGKPEFGRYVRDVYYQYGIKAWSIDI